MSADSAEQPSPWPKDWQKVAESLGYTGDKEQLVEKIFALARPAISNALPLCSPPTSSEFAITLGLVEFDGPPPKKIDIRHWYDWRGGFHTFGAKVNRQPVDVGYGWKTYNDWRQQALTDREARSTVMCHVDKGVWLPGLYVARFAVEAYLRKTRYTSEAKGHFTLWRDIPGRVGYVSQSLGVTKITNRSKVRYAVGNWGGIGLADHRRPSSEEAAAYEAIESPRIPMGRLSLDKWLQLIGDRIDHRDLLTASWPDNLPKAISAP